MKTKNLLLCVSIFLTGPAFAGGYFGDTLSRLGVITKNEADNLDKAHRAQGDVLDGGGLPKSVEYGKNCLTPQGSCSVGYSSLNGRVCYCTFDGKDVFGQIQ